MHGLPRDLCKYVYFYANLQSTVCLVRGKVASLATSQSRSQSFSPCLLHPQGRGSWGCCARGRSVVQGRGIAPPPAQELGVRAAGPWDGRRRWNPRPGNYFLLAYSPPPVAGVCLGSATLHRDVLHLRLGCNYQPPATPSPKMLKYLSRPAQSTGRKEGRREAASASPTLLLIFPRHPPYQHFVPPSLVNWWEKPPRNPRHAGLSCCRKHWIMCEAGSLAAVLDMWKTFHKHFWMLWGFKWDFKEILEEKISTGGWLFNWKFWKSVSSYSLHRLF